MKCRYCGQRNSWGSVTSEHSSPRRTRCSTAGEGPRNATSVKLRAQDLCAMGGVGSLILADTGSHWRFGNIVVAYFGLEMKF